MGYKSAHQRTLLIDPRFQLKYAGWMVGMVAAVLLVLGYVIGRMGGTAVTYAELAISQAEKATKQSHVNSRLAQQNAVLGSGNDPTLIAIMDEELKKMDQQAELELGQIRRQRGELASFRTRQLVVLGASGTALVVVLFGIGLAVTRRVVGPVHKIKGLLRRVSTGRLITTERLRKGDELEDLFDTFLQMTYSLTALQRGRLATLDSTIEHAKKANVPPDVLEGLDALRAQLALGIETGRKN